MEKTLKHTTEVKTSSTRSTDYKFSRCEIAQMAWLPETASITTYQEGPVSFEVSGTLREDETEASWSEPPHVAFANLRTDDPKAVELFVRRYGIFHWNNPDQPFEKESNVGTTRDILSTRARNQQRMATQIGHGIENASRNASGSQTMHFSVESLGLELDQDHLRGVWEDAEPMEELEIQIAARVVVERNGVKLVPEDLWALICLLSVRDYRADKLGVCKNPDCPAPYFKKNRRTQKYCDKGGCVLYAQRQYALDWYNREGKERRQKKSKTQRRGSRR